MHARTLQWHTWGCTPTLTFSSSSSSPLSHAQAKTRAGMTPLLLAIAQGQIEAVHFLLGRNADLRVQSAASSEHGSLTPLLLAVKLRQDSVALAILDKGVPVDEDRDEKGRTAFLLAVQDDHRGVGCVSRAGVACNVEIGHYADAGAALRRLNVVCPGPRPH